MSASKFESLPEDVLYNVLSYLPVPQILRLRRVSQRLKDITYERPVWLNAYRNAPVLKPPGPLPSQSSADIETSLITSLKLHANWTSECPEAVSRLSVFAPEAIGGQMKLVAGRYLMTVGLDSLTCYDLESTNGPTSIGSFKRDLGNAIFDCVVIGEVLQGQRQAQLLCALVKSWAETGRDPIMTLLDIHITPTTIHFEVTAEIPVPRRQSYDDITIARDFLLASCYDPYLVHIPTHQVYLLPSPEFRETTATHRVAVLTASHLVAWTDGPSSVEVFPLPDMTSVARHPQTNFKVLARSHFATNEFTVTEPQLLSSLTTCRSPLITTTRLTFLALCHFSPLSVSPANGIGILTVTFDFEEDAEGGNRPVGLGEMSWRRLVGDSVEYCFCITGSLHAGCARVVALTGFRQAQLCAITLVDGEESEPRILTRTIAVEPQLLLGVPFVDYDGFRGRLCIAGHLSRNMPIAILDFV